MLAGAPGRLVSATKPFSGLKLLDKITERLALKPIQQFLVA
jgi:hypothetical protein